MSDIGSRSESDAVLASIRRILVNGPEPGDDAAVSGPLVLTEALRVDADAPMSTDATRADAGVASAARDPQRCGEPDAPDAQTAQTTAPQDLPDRPARSTLEDTVVDEEFLRDIVSEIVREELQGELGERITRNVRKLVRREIHRAMASRDFD